MMGRQIPTQFGGEANEGNEILLALWLGSYQHIQHLICMMPPSLLLAFFPSLSLDRAFHCERERKCRRIPEWREDED